MCIQGTDKLVIFGGFVAGVADFIGGAIIAAGIITGAMHNFPGYSIALITIGSSIFVVGIGSGCAIQFRAAYLKNEDKEKVVKVTEAVKNGTGIFDDWT